MTLTLAAAPGLAAQQAQTGPIGLTQAVAVAERATGGHVLEAEPEHEKGQLFYEVELVKDGKLHKLMIDSRSGRIARRSAPVVEGYWAKWFDAHRLGGVTRARPLSALLTRLEQQTGGKVVEASFDIEGGQPRYEVEIVTSAGKTDVDLDPRTGERLAMVIDD